MLIIEKSIGDTTSPDFISGLLQEANDKMIEEADRKFRSPAMKRNLMKRCGESAFLIPDKLELPIVEIDCPDCKPNCRLVAKALYEARRLSGANVGYSEAVEKAREILKEECRGRVGIHLEQLEEIIDIEDLLFYLT